MLMCFRPVTFLPQGRRCGCCNIAVNGHDELEGNIAHHETKTDLLCKTCTTRSLDKFGNMFNILSIVIPYQRPHPSLTQHSTHSLLYILLRRRRALSSSPSILTFSTRPLPLILIHGVEEVAQTE